MKKLLLFLVACVAARADQFQFTLTGVVTSASNPASVLTAGDTFSANFIVDDTVADSRPEDTHVGFFTQAAPASVQFSNGFNVGPSALDYVVASQMYIDMLNYDYDGIAFYLHDGTTNTNMGFEIRFPYGTFGSDALVIPQDPISLASNNWYFMPVEQPGNRIAGSISTISVSRVPDTGATALYLLGGGLVLGAVASVARRRTGGKQAA